ncbi:MAG: hypothetical protein Q4E57_03085 [Eubacteriales bacterium]|nr:hypothetical protein [Eubacteriales bacterium]
MLKQNQKEKIKDIFDSSELVMLDLYDEENDNYRFPALLIRTDEERSEVRDYIIKLAEEYKYNFVQISADYSELRNKEYFYTNKGGGHIRPAQDFIDSIDEQDTLLYMEDLIDIEDDIWRRTIIEFIGSHIVLDSRAEKGYKRLASYVMVVIVIRKNTDSHKLREFRTMDAKDSFITVTIE